MAKKRNYEWVTLQYEGASFDVCVSTSVEEVDEIRPTDSEINICPVMRNEVIDWMLEKALTDIHQQDAIHDMNRHEREIEEESCFMGWEASNEIH